jgi:hypothetical protein
MNGEGRTNDFRARVTQRRGEHRSCVCLRLPAKIPRAVGLTECELTPIEPNNRREI